MAQSRRQKPAKGPNLKPFYIALAVVAVAGIVWIGFSLSGAGRSAAIAPIELAGMDDPQRLVSSARGIPVGSADAPVQVLVFSDFTCPACRDYTSSVEGLVKRDYVEQGLVRYTYYDFPLGGEGAHRHGFVAARAARCAEDQGKFWEFHDVLFGRQGEWVYTRTPPLAEMVEYAGLVGLDTAAFETCLESDDHAEVVSANKLLGDRFGVSGTPTIYVGPRQLPSWGDFEEFRRVIEAQLPAGARDRASKPGDDTVADTAGAGGE